VTRVERARFGALPDGRAVDVITLRNGGGTTLRAITWGGAITALMTRDRNGTLGDIVLGFDTLEAYLGDSSYFGAIIGRYGNRIANGRFSLDGVEYELARNNGPNHLHGGLRGFDKVLWKARTFERDDAGGVALSYVSADGEEGYPGELDATVMYTLDDRDELTVEYSATTSAPTVVNLTQHSYFNLGQLGTDVLAHELTIDADAMIPVNAELIPTGEIAPVMETAFDFRSATPIGARIEAPDPQLVAAGGYDHTFVLGGSGVLRRAAFAREPVSGRTMEVATTEPGVQLYSGNFLTGLTQGKGGVVYPKRGGFCLETQHFPDSPNQPRFPTTVLRRGERYQSRTVFRFGAA
jgi:aldose 1-epimerase